MLVHVGTNGKDWDEKPRQVEEMLNMIDSFSVKNNHPVTVLLNLIINRFAMENQAPTTRLNNEITMMVDARTGDRIRIILVDIEKGAGLDYTHNFPDPDANPPDKGGDMLGTRFPGFDHDRYHPDDSGNRKMAVMVFQELIKILFSPNEGVIK